MDSRGIEPRTTPMLREYYTTKPQAQFDGIGSLLMSHKPRRLFFEILKLPGQIPPSKTSTVGFFLILDISCFPRFLSLEGYM